MEKDDIYSFCCYINNAYSFRIYIDMLDSSSDIYVHVTKDKIEFTQTTKNDILNVLIIDVNELTYFQFNDQTKDETGKTIKTKEYDFILSISNADSKSNFLSVGKNDGFELWGLQNKPEILFKLISSKSHEVSNGNFSKIKTINSDKQRITIPDQDLHSNKEHLVHKMTIESFSEFFKKLTNKKKNDIKIEINNSIIKYTADTEGDISNNIMVMGELDDDLDQTKSHKYIIPISIAKKLSKANNLSSKSVVKIYHKNNIVTYIFNVGNYAKFYMFMKLKTQNDS